MVEAVPKVADVRKLDIGSADAIENDTDYTVDGLPPHSFEIIVLGGAASDEEIAACIFKNKPAGIQAVGGTPAMALNADGLEREVRFTHASPVRINVNYQGTFDETYVPGSLQAAIEAATRDQYEGPTSFGIGRDVYLVRLMTAGLRTQGVLNLAIDAARHPAVPADAIPTAPNAVIAIGPREVAHFAPESWVGNGVAPRRSPTMLQAAHARTRSARSPPRAQSRTSVPRERVSDALY